MDYVAPAGVAERVFVLLRIREYVLGIYRSTDFSHKSTQNLKLEYNQGI